ncbi:uncharacterized protein FPRO_10339 [Fusarium proliferatum ET1]|uniref:Uncharacterized protein n=1 Tax=Fusarium proliferatum (strain ET1) TaxID=1227346 RepID=A0A1L7VJJ0_FUSPR|nr:uncharacterized protein FPRO_10339 [Fusarium proliferatum ET1]CZR40751.1 uncharacterized protein FPRO_10339 [Fusarium proliferatum ET1]
MPRNRPRAQGSTKSPFERQRARDGYRRRQSRRQQAAAHESGGGHAESNSNGVQGVEGHPSDAGHVGMTGDRDEAGPQVQQTAEAAVQEASTSPPHLETTRLAQDMSSLAIADPAIQQGDAHIEQPNSGPQDPDQIAGDVAPDQVASNLPENMDLS